MAEGPVGPASRALWDRARLAIPGGVNSPVRSFRSVGGQPYFVARAEGAYVWDADGRRLIDYVQSYGASILGHAHPSVTRAVQGAAARGTSFGAPTEAEVRLAEAVAERVGGCEQLRLVSSGTEAAMTAVRLARAATGRDTVVKFDGCYHGHSDALLAGSGSGVATLGLPGSAGVPASAVAHTLVVPYNQVPVLAPDVACVVVEPVAANMGLVPPAPGFLEGLRRECWRVGALLVFDEVITGFRLGPGGASERFSVRPDLWCFGKVLGGGLPIGAVGGRRELMEELAPLGPVYQAGTLSGNPLATAAGLATLSELDRGSYEALEATAARLASGLAEALSSAGVAAQVPVVGPLVGLFFSPRPVSDFQGARAADAEAYARFFHGLLGRGVALAPGAYEAVFPSLAHSDRDVRATVEAAAEAAAEVAGREPVGQEGR
ncbi:MAG TPA: glutamate-1-semialdehyde 2,1-aminomutase [Acidimicrobiales bacterium]|nr:glutamate-1-semialdehyde 2,1-aminomutase [Acidimicrobiales bacterium]